MGDRTAADVARRHACDLLAIDRHAAGCDGDQAGQRKRQLALAVARHARDTDDFAGPDLEGHALDRRQPDFAVAVKPVDREHCPPGRGRRPRQVHQHVAPDHHARQFARRRVAGPDRGDDMRVAHHAHAVAHPHHLVELVRDEDDRLAGHREVAQQLQQPVGLLRGQDRRRLVEDQKVDAVIEHLEDLDPLLLADGKVLDQRVGFYVEAVARAQCGDALVNPGHVADHPQRRALPQNVVLSDSQVRHQHEVLVHHPDALPDRLARRPDADRSALVDDLALIRRQYAAQNVHQHALACPVLAEQCVDLVLFHFERNAAARDDVAEPLVDVVHPQEWLAAVVRAFHGRTASVTPCCRERQASSASRPCAPSRAQRSSLRKAASAAPGREC